ncbi:MAG: hypothetical protein Tsb0010_03520 [Parvularculaceae bacterium]
MKFLRLLLSLVLAAFLAFMGMQKFAPGDNPIFSLIAANSGIALFEPEIRMAVGATEFAAAGLLLLGVFNEAARKFGALLALGVMVGAVGFHLSPWLGISVPMEAGGEASTALFMAACVFLVVAVANLLLATKDLD